MTYDKLLIEAECDGLTIKEKPLQYGFKGLYKNNKIIVDKNIETTKEKACILAEELGHHYTSFGKILDLSDIGSAKQEKRARNWAYEKLIGLSGLIRAYQDGIQGTYSLAEYFNVTEDFLLQAIEYYKNKYGIYKKIDNYIIRFDSLSIVEDFGGLFDY